MLDELAWAVAAAAKYVPGATCLVQALTLEAWAGAHNAPVQTQFGVFRDEAGRLNAHAWVESEGRVILGATEPGRFALLTAIED